MLLKIISCLLLASSLQVINAREFQFLNKLPGEVWVGCQGNPDHANLNNGGWILPAGERMSVYSADNWAGRFWARTYCNIQTEHCLTGDCGNKIACQGAGGTPPASLAEITLKGSGGLDYYDISLVDGFNVEISMEPLGGQGDGSTYSCKKTSCTYNILGQCPSALQVTDNGRVIACNSACNAFHTDEYCCTGAYNSPNTCPNSDYSKFFKDRCPDAYSYAYDDHKSTFTCNAPAYLVTFGA